ncbi:LysR family transcriptional regulator [Salinicola tamaricis]|uniref:LysR family transcriptional regulator n=1 Tax=Salinicola tamaricis TaxID=1771309 RepID=UPI001A924153|nr:LysR family transcriptional regulator [Salinicola tamaricis]
MLYTEGSVSAAAMRLGLSQPALSHKLARLRHDFGDALFVRAPRGLTPTPRAHELAPRVQQLVAGLESFFDFCEGSDFLTREAGCISTPPTTWSSYCCRDCCR